MSIVIPTSARLPLPCLVARAGGRCRLSRRAAGSARYLFNLSQIRIEARDHALYQSSDLLPPAPSVARCHVQQSGVGAVRDGAQAMRG